MLVSEPLSAAYVTVTTTRASFFCPVSWQLAASDSLLRIRNIYDCTVSLIDAVNLEESIAITQNYVSASNLSAVCKFLRTKPDQISGLEAVQDALDDGDGAFNCCRQL